MTEPICCGQVNNGKWCQETYETSRKMDARTRAKQLREAGYLVAVFPLGLQVTRVGTVGLTMVDIRPGINHDTFNLPEVKIERI